MRLQAVHNLMVQYANENIVADTLYMGTTDYDEFAHDCQELMAFAGALPRNDNRAPIVLSHVAGTLTVEHAPMLNGRDPGDQVRVYFPCVDAPGGVTVETAWEPDVT